MISRAVEFERNPQAGRVGPTANPSLVKSAKRVVHILEMFDVLRRPASVTEIAQRLNMPQSSTSVLLRSMLELGYLAYDGEHRLFEPTSSVALLGAWINPMMSVEGRLLAAASALAKQVGLAVIIALRNGVMAQFAHVENVPEANFQAYKGMAAPLTMSALGLPLMTELSDSEIRRVAIRIDYEAGTKTCLKTLYQRVTDYRSTGDAVMPEIERPDLAVLAVALPSTRSSENLAIGVAGPTMRVMAQRTDLLVELQTLIKTGQNEGGWPCARPKRLHA